MKLILKAFLSVGLIWMSMAQLGCASGGFKLTRQYAHFVNRQNIVIRVVLYLLTAVVFAATLLIDMVIFNTMDFWEGRVSANTYQFEKDGRTYMVRHFYEGPQKLRNTEIKIYSSAGKVDEKLEQTLKISEQANGEVLFFQNGVLKARAADIYDLPSITRYDEKGHQLSEVPLSLAGI
jgi:hypothetical protein